MSTWPSPRSERLGTPKVPAIHFTRGTSFEASRFAYVAACQIARPPAMDRTGPPRPQRAFTSRLPAGRSPSPPLDMTTTWAGPLLLAGLSPAGTAASLAAPDPGVRLSRTGLLPEVGRDRRTRASPRISEPLAGDGHGRALSGSAPGASPVVRHPSDRAPFPPRPPPPLLTALFERFPAVGSEEARSIALALASVRRSNWTCGFPSFHGRPCAV